MFDCDTFTNVTAAAPSPPEPTSPEELRRRLADLSKEFASQRRRLGAPPDEAATIDRMHRTIASHRVRLERLEHEAAAILSEITRLEDELHGREKALALLLGTVVERIGQTFRDAWSPVPVLGYRLWSMRRGALHGARTCWPEPTFTATCSAFNGAAPHTDGRCGRLGCGVYATKELPSLVSMHIDAESHSYVAALVALTGTVVEHERGYRAETAQVVAAYAVWPDRVLATHDPRQIATIFAGCDRVPSEWCGPWPHERTPVPDLVHYLRQRAKEEAAWI